MQENRSFDHYFQALPENSQPDVDVAPAASTNPDPEHNGEPVVPYATTDPCPLDVPHSWPRPVSGELSPQPQRVWFAHRSARITDCLLLALASVC